MKYIYATRVVDASADVVNVEALLHKQPLQIDLCETDVCKMQSGSHVILDFGKEVSGGARILAFQGTRVPVRLRFGESVSETCSEIRETPDEPKTSTNDHSLRDFRVELQEFSDMTFGQTGFRFLRIDVEGEGKTLELKSVLAAVTNDTRRAKGSFECDDPLVNQIWETAAYTLRLCIQNGYIWDGVKRDRLVWIGDLYPEIRAAACVFGEIPEGLRSLEFSMKQAPLPQYINRMPTYSLWWLICLCESYRMSGDKNKYNAYLSYAKGVVEQVIAPAVAEDGTVSYCFNYIDWPSCAQEGEDKTEERNKERLAGVSYLTQVALNGVKEFLSQFGENTDLCDELLTKIKQKSYEIHLYKQIAALGVWAGDCSESIKNTLLSNGGKGLSTFQSYPILTAVAKFGAYEEALSMMKEYYGGMLSVGATTFWEDFDLSWLDNCYRIDEMPQEGKKDVHGDYGAFCYLSYRHSLCHGWSAGVIPYLVETVAGIKPQGAGMRRIVIEPNLSGLKKVKVKYPTPYGILEVKHTVKGGKVYTSVISPKDVEVEIKNK